MKIEMLIGAAVAALVASPAYAQEEAKSNFEGAYVGALGGFDSVTLSFEGEEGSENGPLYGVAAGYDIKLGGVIGGVEVEWSDSSTKQSVGDILFSGDSASLAAGRDLYAGIKLGVPVSENVMVYAKGGYSNASFKLTYDDGAGTSLSASDELGGIRVGAGVEMTSDRIFVRAEYRYSDYGDYSFDGVNTGISANRGQVAAIFGLRF